MADAGGFSFTDSQRLTLRELGSRGSGGNFDQQAMGKLFEMGLVEVRGGDRRLVLTERGKVAYQQMMAADQGR